jgi:UDP-glucose 4-epimerase
LPYQEAYGAGFEDMNRRVPDLSLIQNLVGWTPKRNLTSIIIDIAEEMKGTIKAR